MKKPVKAPPLRTSVNELARIILKEVKGNEIGLGERLAVFRELVRWEQIRNKIGDADDDDATGTGHAFNSYRKEIETAGSGKPRSATPLADLSRYTPPSAPDPADDGEVDD